MARSKNKIENAGKRQKKIKAENRIKKKNQIKVNAKEGNEKNPEWLIFKLWIKQKINRNNHHKNDVDDIANSALGYARIIHKQP